MLRIVSDVEDVERACLSAGIKQGIDEDQLVAMELGADSPQELSDLAKTYKDKIKAKLKQVGPQHTHAYPNLV